MADKIPTDGGSGLGNNPFAALHGASLQPGPGHAAKAPQASPREGNRGRVEITREKGGRGGKTVTVVDGFTGIGHSEKQELMRKVRTACGCGGTVKEGRIEIQGDHRATIALILNEAGFRPVFAGG